MKSVEKGNKQRLFLLTIDEHYEYSSFMQAPWLPDNLEFDLSLASLDMFLGRARAKVDFVLLRLYIIL